MLLKPEEMQFHAPTEVDQPKEIPSRQAFSKYPFRTKTRFGWGGGTERENERERGREGGSKRVGERERERELDRES